MLIQNAIKQILAVPDGWVRVEQVRYLHSGLELCLAIQSSKCGRTIATWTVECWGVQEVKITDFNGGGIALYGNDHPAAKQYSARWSELRWPSDGSHAAVLKALYDVHIDMVDDWIPFERYVLPNLPYKRGFESRSHRQFACRGPGFLIRAYAKALRTEGKTVRVIRLKTGTQTKPRPKVLHFGCSHTVADSFEAQRDGTS